MAIKKIALLGPLIFGMHLCACAPGYIYTDVVEPYCTNMDNTSVGKIIGRSDTKQIKLPYLAPGLTAIWSSNAIGDAAKQAGITTLEYCDLRTLSILGGVWQQQNIIVYGE